MNAEEFRRRGKEMIDYAADYLEKNIRTYPPLSRVEPGYLKQLIPKEAPDEPEAYDDLMKDVTDLIMPGITHWHCPQFHAYYPTGNSYPAICADILSDAIGCVGFSWAASPACTELEIVMMDWLAKMLQLPEDFLSGGNGGGVLLGTASEATLTALLAARNKKLASLNGIRNISDIGGNLGKLIAYFSDQAHLCAERSCLFGAVRGHKVTSNDADEMTGDALKAAIKEDKAKGLIPFFVVVTLGTTPSCSFDHLAEIGPICKAEGISLHIDAAYAGSAFICPEFRGYLDGIEFADSFNFNPHKWLLVNFDCSAMWYKDARSVVDAFSIDALFLSHKNEGKVRDYRHWQIAFGSRFRSLKLWFVIRLYGIKGLQQYIRKHVFLAKQFEEMVRRDSRFVVTHKVVLGLVCFRLKDKSNDLNVELLKRIDDDGRIHMVPCKSRGIYFLRFVVCSAKTELTDIQFAWKVITEIATQLLEDEKNIK